MCPSRRRTTQGAGPRPRVRRPGPPSPAQPAPWRRRLPHGRALRHPGVRSCRSALPATPRRRARRPAGCGRRCRVLAARHAPPRSRQPSAAPPPRGGRRTKAATAGSHLRCSHVVEAKRLVRASVVERRSLLTDAERDAAGRSLLAHGLALGGGGRVVTASAAVGAEPPTRPLLEALVERGVRVLLPVVGADGALEWGDLIDWAQLEQSASGLLEPAATTGATAAAQSADLALVPALAVDRTGHRLGRGGGYFDRWLAGATPARVRAVGFDHEALPAVPQEPHDQRVDAALTPSGVISMPGG